MNKNSILKKSTLLFNFDQKSAKKDKTAEFRWVESASKGGFLLTRPNDNAFLAHSCLTPSFPHRIAFRAVSNPTSVSLINSQHT